MGKLGLSGYGIYPEREIFTHKQTSGKKKKTKEGTHSCEMFWGPKTVPELQPASWNLGENEQVHCKRRTPSLMINSQHFQSISIAYLGCPDLPLFSQNVAVFSLSIGYDF